MHPIINADYINYLPRGHRAAFLFSPLSVVFSFLSSSISSLLTVTATALQTTTTKTPAQHRRIKLAAMSPRASSSSLPRPRTQRRARSGGALRLGVTLLAAAASVALPGAHAASFDIVGRPRAPATAALEHARRAIDINGAFGNGSTTVVNSGDTIYSCNITLGGSEFEVLIDTGR